MDVDTIEPGVDFSEAISRALAACQVLVAVVGRAWLTATDERGRRRLDDPDDFVRLEIETALERGVRVIPVLAQGAVMPGRDDLPQSLAGLARRNALYIRHESFRSDAGRLVMAIERVQVVAPGLASAPGAFDTPGGQSAGKAVGEVVQTDSGPGQTGRDRTLAPPMSPDRSVTVNISQQLVNAIESTIVQNIRGTTNISPEAKELLSLVKRFGDQNTTALESAVHELEDQDARLSDRLGAKQRLKGFLIQLNGKVEDAALTILQVYLESKMDH